MGCPPSYMFGCQVRVPEVKGLDEALQQAGQGMSFAVHGGDWLQLEQQPFLGWAQD